MPLVSKSPEYSNQYLSAIHDHLLQTSDPMLWGQSVGLWERGGRGERGGIEHNSMPLGVILSLVELQI